MILFCSTLIERDSRSYDNDYDDPHDTRWICRFAISAPLHRVIHFFCLFFSHFSLRFGADGKSSEQLTSFIDFHTVHGLVECELHSPSSLGRRKAHEREVIWCWFLSFLGENCPLSA